MIAHLKEKKTAGMIDMRLAPFSKDNDDLSITNSMEENYQNWRQNVALGAIWTQNSESALKS